MPINGVRVLPSMPPNIPHLQTLIRGFETTFDDWSSQRGSGSESSISSSGGNFVKKIVQAYEMNMKVSTEDVQQEQREKRSRSSLFSNLEIIRNWKNAEKSDSSPTMYEFSSNLPASNNLQMKSTILSIQSSIGGTLDNVEDDFVTPNRHCSNSDDGTAVKIRPKVSSKINMYGPESELPKQKTCQSFCSPLTNNVEDQWKNNKSMTFSSLLEEDDDKDNDPLDNILTNSRERTNISGVSDNSYRNLQVDLYNFDLELSSSSLPSLKFSSESLHDDVLSASTDSYFPNITMTPSKDISNGPENLHRDTDSAVMQSCFKLESSCVIGAPLERPTKVDSSVCVTWASAISERLSREKGSLKKILSTINSRLSLTCKKIGKRRKQRKEQRRIIDSGFAEQFPSSLSHLPQKSWYSDNEKPPTSPTFGTFGHVKTSNECRASSRRTADNPRIVLTEVSHEKLANDLSDSISWVSIRSTPSSSRKRVDLSSSSKLKASCERPLVPKHPYLSRIPKHPFVAQTKMDQIKEKERAAEKEEVRLYASMELTMTSDEQEPRSMNTSSTLVPPISALNISYPKTCEWVASSPKISCNLPR